MPGKSRRSRARSVISAARTGAPTSGTTSSSTGASPGRRPHGGFIQRREPPSHRTHFRAPRGGVPRRHPAGGGGALRRAGRDGEGRRGQGRLPSPRDLATGRGIALQLHPRTGDQTQPKCPLDVAPAAECQRPLGEKKCPAACRAARIGAASVDGTAPTFAVWPGGRRKSTPERLMKAASHRGRSR